jgi:hypothetical protein
MKRIVIGGLVGLALGLLTSQIAAAQGSVTYLSNLGQTPDGNNSVASDSWLAASFVTGTNVSAYSLNSVQLSLADSSGTPTGFVVMIYAQSESRIGIFPGSSLGQLSGSANPTTGNTYAYNATSSLSLAPSTVYFIVLAGGTTAANGAYSWNYMNSYSYQATDGWGASVTLDSSDGSTWTRLGGNPLYDYSQFAINATAAPEPGVVVLMAVFNSQPTSQYKWHTLAMELYLICSSAIHVKSY